MAYIVTAALVIAYDDQGRQVYAYEGETLPHQIAAGEGERLADLDMVREVTEVAGEQQQPTGDDDDADPGPADEQPGKQLADMTVAELKAHLAEAGIPFEGVTAKADLLALAQQ